MLVLYIVTLGFFAYSIFRTVKIIRRKRVHHAFSGLIAFRDTMTIACYAIGNIYLISIISPKIVYSPGFYYSILMSLIFGIALTWAVNLIIESMRKSDSLSLLAFVTHIFSTIGNAAFARTLNLNRLLAPKGWGEIRFKSSEIEAFFSFRNFMRLYAATFLLLPPVAAMLVVKSLRQASPELQTILTTVIGVNALLVASCVTAGTLITLLICMVLHSLGIFRVPMDYPRAVPRLAAFVGYGTALGAFTAALLPVFNVVFPPSSADQIVPSAAASMISPQLLIDLPAGGAVAGYIIGLVAIIINIGRKATNILYGNLLVPSVFIAVSWLIPKMQITPIAMFDRVVSDWQGGATGACIGEYGMQEMFDSGADPATILMAASQCSAPVILHGNHLALALTFLTAGWAMAAIVRATWKLNKRTTTTEKNTTTGTMPGRG